MSRLRSLLSPVEYVSRSVSPKWKAFLAVYAPHKVEAVSECRTWFASHDCDGDNVDGVSHRFAKIVLCGERVYCPTCAKVRADDYAHDAFDLIVDLHKATGKALKYVSFVFTFPREVWPKVGEGNAGEVRRDVMEVLKRVFGEDGRYRLFVDVAFHYWHSSNPFAGWYPHVHGIILCLGVDSETCDVGLDGSSVRPSVARLDLRWKVGSDETRLKLVKDFWREKVESRFGLLPSRCRTCNEKFDDALGLRAHLYFNEDHEESRFDVRWDFRHTPKDLQHDLSYMYRYSVVDFYKYVIMAKFPEEADPVVVKRLLSFPEQYRRIARSGAFAGNVFSQLMKALGSPIEAAGVRKRSRREILCPARLTDGTLCGCQIHRVERTPSYDLNGLKALCIPILGYEPGGGIDWWKW